MTEPEHFAADNKALRVTTYIVLGVIFLGLLIVAVATFRTVKSNQAADQKADQLIAALQAKGLKAPSKEQITRTLGDDGGAMCADPNSALTTGLQRMGLSNGAGGPGMRPIIASKRLVEGEKIAIEIYCPDQAAEFQQYLDSHKYADVIKG